MFQARHVLEKGLRHAGEKEVCNINFRVGTFSQLQFCFRQGVQSRYKTATFKHRPPVEKPHIMAMPPKNKLFDGKCSSEVIHHSPLVSPYTEEKVVTMVEMENEKNKGNDNEMEMERQSDGGKDGDADDVKDIVQELVTKVATEGKVSTLIV